ncbi:hypothetical protein AVDCRST_MAG84-2050 [uncultured Microcoleus sp.]|uniref:Uncharacterized protein n=1 Tax=uncultured Microcoleus sp. TaxID=259945 RepID=A0A6J4LKJ5_9CYAN|nr:hypothetical protein AVDCRST_MAG84-2050 [uncultured Microcoleus sp.]
MYGASLLKLRSFFVNFLSSTHLTIVWCVAVRLSLFLCKFSFFDAPYG